MFKKVLVTLLLWSISLAELGAQELEPFSSFCRNATADTSRIESLLRKAKQMAGINPDSAILLYRSAIQESTEKRYTDGAAFGYMGLGVRYAEQGKYELSNYCYAKAIPYCMNPVFNKALVAALLNNIGFMYFWRGNFKDANQFYFAALNYLEDKHLLNSQISALTFHNLGSIHIRQNQPDKAIVYLNRCEVIARKNDYGNELALCLMAQGIIHNRRNEFREAKHHYDEALKVAERVGNTQSQIGALMNLGCIGLGAHQPSQAIPYFMQALELSRKSRMIFAGIAASGFLAEAYFQQKDYDKAKEILAPELARGVSMGIRPDLVSGYTTLARIYKATGDFRQALAAQEKRFDLNDSLLSLEKANAINLLDVKYRTAEQDKVIANDKLKIAEQENHIARKNLMIGSISACALLVCAILVGLYRFNLHQKNLLSEKIRRLEHEQEISVLRAMMAGEENERGRIARDLHDGIGGMLSASLMRFTALKHEHKSIASTPAYNDIAGLLEEIGAEIRKTSHNLMPEILTRLSLSEAVRSFCNHIHDKGGLSIDVQTYGDFSILTHELRLTIYRIIQELVHNVVKHAHAQHAIVQLMLHATALSITVEDDGKGFDTKETFAGLGLKNLKTRVYNLKGNISIESATGQGTTTYIEMDVKDVTEISLPAQSLA